MLGVISQKYNCVHPKWFLHIISVRIVYIVQLLAHFHSLFDGVITGKLPNTVAGTPPTQVYTGTFLLTTEPGVTTAQSPTLMFPSTVQPAPRLTKFPILGCRSPVSFPVPPNVTPCETRQLSPSTAVSPITMPVPDFTTHFFPMWQAGWISAPNVRELSDWKYRLERFKVWLSAQGTSQNSETPTTPCIVGKSCKTQ